MCQLGVVHSENNNSRDVPGTSVRAVCATAAHAGWNPLSHTGCATAQHAVLDTKPRAMATSGPLQPLGPRTTSCLRVTAHRPLRSAESAAAAQGSVAAPARVTLQPPGTSARPARP